MHFCGFLQVGINVFQVRYFLAKLGLRNLQEAIGRTDLLYANPNPLNSKAVMLEFEPLLRNANHLYPEADNRPAGTIKQDFGIDKRLEKTVA